MYKTDRQSEYENKDVNLKKYAFQFDQFENKNHKIIWRDNNVKNKVYNKQK